VRLSDAEVAVAAAEAGAVVVRARFGAALARFDKSAMDFATDADIDAEKAVLEMLRAARPSDAYQGEELGASGDDSADRTTCDETATRRRWHRLRQPGSSTSTSMFPIPTFGTRVISTTLALVWVAAGRYAAYVTDGHLRDSVHFSSGIALCQAAGCVVSGLRGQPLHTGIGGLVAVGDAVTHAALMALIDQQLES
jgi:fructose-1,6-bisphosphatase/inositol monophosphatase family enzyme